jgi:hypothetical protein
MEMDGNLAELDRRIQILENLAQSENTMTVENQYDALVFKNGLGFEVGRAVLPKWMPRLRGDWQPGEAYAFGDWVRYDEKLYFCKTPHVAPFTPMDCADVFEINKWELLIG